MKHMPEVVGKPFVFNGHFPGSLPSAVLGLFFTIKHMGLTIKHMGKNGFSSP